LDRFAFDKKYISLDDRIIINLIGAIGLKQ